VTIPDSVTTIEYGAFVYCIDIAEITIGSGLASIGDYAFSDLYELSSLTLPDSVKSIGAAAFIRCVNISDFTIPDGVKSIGDYTFANCNRLTSITIPDSVTSIGYRAFDSILNSATLNVYYKGTKEQWAAITFDTGNDYLKKGNIHYNYTG
jgi:hypothetical protein